VKERRVEIMMFMVVTRSRARARVLTSTRHRDKVHITPGRISLF